MVSMNLKFANKFLMPPKADEFQNAHAQMSTFRKQKLIPSEKSHCYGHIHFIYVYIAYSQSYKILLHIAIDIDRYTNTPREKKITTHTEIANEKKSQWERVKKVMNEKY